MPVVDSALVASLLLLVVTAMATASRTIDLVQVSIQSADEVYLLHFDTLEPLARPLVDRSLHIGWVAALVDGEARDPGDLPTFGRFNQIHAFNSFLLSSALALIALAENSLAGGVIAGIVGVFWMTLPMLEIDEYDRMMSVFRPGDSIDSVSFNMLGAFALTTIAVLVSLVDVSGHPVWLRGLGVVGFVSLGVFVLGNGFLWQLKSEIELLATAAAADS